jgi:DHA1 family tetracycline resistance protein-like MFS transporter
MKDKKDATSKKDAATKKAAWANVPAGHPNMSESSDVNSCPWLSQSADEEESKFPPSNGGVVPNSVFLAIVLDITAVGLVIPLMSRYAKHLGGGAAFTGLLSTIYGVCQLIGSSVLGNLSDTRGRKFVLMLSMAGALTGYFLLYLAVGWFHSMALLFISRLPIGLLKQTMCVSRALISDCSTREDRYKMMSRLGGAAGLGFVIGPMSGGILSAVYSETFPPMLSCCLVCTK